MKGLSIEEKAKAYDEALEKARQLCAYPTTKPFISDLQDLFPELAMSKDERIRKELIRAFKSLNTIKVWNGIERTDIIAWLEKQKPIQNINKEDEEVRQKPIDKVEPKFKVGVWLVNNERKNIIKVVNHTPLDYEVVDVLGYHHTITDTAIEKNYHLWTIEDARPGDVLAIEWNQDNDVWEKILIFKALNDIGVEGYGNTFKNNDLFFIDENVPYYSKTWTKTLHPATKEQCDILFEEMKESGYEWDSEKKELKKIESTNKVNPFDKYEGLTDFERTLADTCTGWIGEELGWKQYIKDNADVLLKIAIKKFNSAQNASIEQNPAWSEKDEMMLNETLGAIAATDYYTLDDKKEIEDWLKSLRPQKCLIPSEEEIEKAAQEWDLKAYFNPFYMTMNGDKPTGVVQHITTHKESFKAGINWIFKFLRPQNRWKPSEEQMNALDSTLQYSQVSHNSYEHLNSLYNDLKKLTE